MKESTVVYKVFGVVKNEIRARLSEIEDKKIKIFFDTDVSNDTKIVLKYSTDASQKLIDETNAFIIRVFGENLYAVDDFSLAQVAVDLLTLYKRRLSIAESLTGGQISSDIVDVPGASDVLVECCVTYSNESKQSRLYVKKQTLSQFGAVSSEVAYQMATGLLNTSACDVVLATTGIAGPSGGSDIKPVGLTYIAVGDMSGIHIHKYIFSGDRNEIRKKAVNTALFLLIKLIKERK